MSSLLAEGNGSALRQELEAAAQDRSASDRSFRSGRNGENDYAKTAITEPLAACLEALEGLRCKAEQAKRFILRSVVGASLGLALHSLATRLWGKSEKAD